MKKVIIILLGILFCGNVFSQGIKFEDYTYEKALAKAKAENKMVFIDCYTVWCAPCKKLAKEVFPQERVGDFFNEHFVSIKMDMEKDEGIELGVFYNVHSFPTLLFLNAQGELVHRVVGLREAESLIKEAKVAIKAPKEKNKEITEMSGS